VLVVSILLNLSPIFVYDEQCPYTHIVTSIFLLEIILQFLPSIRDFLSASFPLSPATFFVSLWPILSQQLWKTLCNFEKEFNEKK
jgi:hypothetical protein